MAMLFSFSAFADEVNIPFAINKTKFLEETKSLGLDLYDNETSDGFIKNEGQKFIVYTYKTITVEQLNIIKDCTFKSLRD